VEGIPAGRFTGVESSGASVDGTVLVEPAREVVDVTGAEVAGASVEAAPVVGGASCCSSAVDTACSSEPELQADKPRIKPATAT